MSSTSKVCRQSPSVCVIFFLFFSDMESQTGPCSLGWCCCRLSQSLVVNWAVGAKTRAGHLFARVEHLVALGSALGHRASALNGAILIDLTKTERDGLWQRRKLKGKSGKMGGFSGLIFTFLFNLFYFILHLGKKLRFALALTIFLFSI